MCFEGCERESEIALQHFVLLVTYLCPASFSCTIQCFFPLCENCCVRENIHSQPFSFTRFLSHKVTECISPCLMSNLRMCLARELCVLTHFSEVQSDRRVCLRPSQRLFELLCSHTSCSDSFLHPNFPTRLETRTKEFNWIASRRGFFHPHLIRRSESNLPQPNVSPIWRLASYLRYTHVVAFTIVCAWVILSHTQSLAACACFLFTSS